MALLYKNHLGKFVVVQGEDSKVFINEIKAIKYKEKLEKSGVKPDLLKKEQPRKSHTSPKHRRPLYR